MSLDLGLAELGEEGPEGSLEAVPSNCMSHFTGSRPMGIIWGATLAVVLLLNGIVWTLVVAY